MYLAPGSQPQRHIRLAENPRTRVKAAIKRASKTARADMRRLVAGLEKDLEQVYRDAVNDLRTYLDAAAPDGDSLRLEVMRDLLSQSEVRLSQLEQLRNGMLDQGLLGAADKGVAPFTADAARIGTNLTQVADDAVRFTVSFVAEDGLQLSDRLWAIDNGARESVAGAIQRSIIQGHSASQAAQEFLARGEAVPNSIAQKANGATPGRIHNNIRSELLTGDGSAYANALRVFRTEINRAHGEAYQAAAFEHPDVIGTRFLLSPRHPRVDICDMHAKVNRYGLGPGVYPKGKSPWPAHPNTLSFVEVVFDDEVTDDDRAGKEDRISWLKRQDVTVQYGVLGSKAKQQALRLEVLRENEINTPWRVLKKKYQRRGVDIGTAVPGTSEPVAPPVHDDGVIIKTTLPDDFPVAETLAGAGKIGRKYVIQARAHQYLKDDAGQYLIRYRHGPRFLPDNIRKKKYNKVSYAGLQVETANATNRMLHEVDQVAEKLGLPALRGVNTAAGQAAASMGDGVLAISKYNDRYFKKIPSRSELKAQYLHQIQNKQQQIEDAAKYWEGTRLETIRKQIQKDIDEYQARIRRLDDNVPVEVVIDPPSTWKPGSSEIAPRLSDQYFSFRADKFKSTIWHEFGHHIHQQLGVRNAKAYMDPPLERDLLDLYRKPGRVFPTQYSRTNHKEWFAESYSLYRLGRSDLLDPELLDLIRNIESGGYTP